MKYFDAQHITTKAEHSRHRGDIFLIGDERIVGRVAKDGFIELVDNEPDEVVLRFDPKGGKYPDVFFKSNGERHVDKLLEYTFHHTITKPKLVTDAGLTYKGWNYYHPGHNGSEAKTDGWIRLVHSKGTNGYGSVWTIADFDHMPEMKINEEARKVFLDEVKRVRRLLRIRAKLEVFQWDKIPNRIYEKSTLGPRAQLAAVQGEDLKGMLKFMGYLVGSYIPYHNYKKLIARYDAWISRHRRTLYSEFNCYTNGE